MAENIGKRLEQKESKQKKAKKPSRLTKGQKWLLAVAIVLAVVLVAVVALDGLFVKPELPGKGNGSNADGTQAGDGIDYGDGVQPRVSGERKSQDYYTVLILGRDTGGGGNTDTMLLASYASAMTHWVGFGSKLPLVGSTADVVTSSTPMAVMKGIFSAETAEDALAAVNDLTSTFSISDMFIGRIGGSLGETSALALLLGFVYLLLRRVINWQIPVCYIGTVAVLTLISAPAGMSAVDFMLYNVFGGGLMLGAIFMATDYATSPVTKLGQAIFGVGCGLITCFIRRFGSYPEGVCYSILIMNCTTWLLDKYIRPTIYGAIKKDKKEAAAK